MTDQAARWQSIEERMTRLERQNRRLKRAGAAGLAAFGLLVLMAQNVPQNRGTVEAQHFVLRDEHGTIRGRWDAGASEVTLSFLDRNSTSRIHLGLNGEDNGDLIFWDRNSNAVAQLGMEASSNPHPHPALLLWSTPGKAAAVALRALPDRSDLALAGSNLEASLTASDQHTFLAFGKTGPMGAGISNMWLGASPDGSLLSIKDAQGFSATIGNASLETPSSHGGTSHTSAASLILFNNKGNVIWRAP